jgi:hypothetical protein
VAKIVRGGQSGSLDHANTSQATFRTQISALTDAVRQLGGNPEIAAGATINDPLNAPYVLYVNPYTGKDTFVGGSYSTTGSATERIELQRLECGYSEARPFKTINRAIIEAGIVTAKSYYESPLINNDLVSIILMPGAATVLNGTGAASVTEWASTKSPTDADLQAFNPNATGGVLLPRGVSLCGLDLRKTILRPESVPANADEASDASNRRTIFKVTGTGYYFGFTFMDKVGSTSSHHLLSAFEFASQAELDEFYTKIRSAFGGTNNTGNLSNALAVTKASEYEITAPQPTAGSQTIATDTTLSASPYIFNCSIRSNYGLCGVYADGAKVSGFRSIVLAQFTGVSLQRDLSCWQKYDSGESTAWGAYFANYADYINTAPDNVRMHPTRRSFHIRAVNNAIIQEVSVFAIGQGIHHWTQNGGELTITNSNSNFGGCAAVSEGYRSSAFAADTDWNVNRIRVATNLSDIANNVRRIYLGTISAVTSTSITLTTALGESTTVAGVPDLLARDGYSLRNGSYVWVENPLGADWRTTLTSSAWASGAAAVINTSAALADETGETPGATTAGVNRAVGKRVYVRRLVDTRVPGERRYTLTLNNTSQSARTPLRDYVLQVKTGAASINSVFPTSTTILVGTAAKITASGVAAASEVVLRRGNASVDWTASAQYQKGETVKRNGKHYSCNTPNRDSAFDSSKWDESFVHMASGYNPEDFYKTETPILVFDNDTSGLQNSTTLGYNLSTVWTTDAAIQAQYRSAADYRGLHLFLTALGFTAAQADTILVPKALASRDRNPASSADMGGFVPAGAANARANWPVEFRRPSMIRLFGHAWEWSGFLNYTKAIPQYQGELSAQNKFSYYFTNVDGGRVYATGFNEEGYQISPRGIEDISTGNSLTVDNLGTSDITIDQPTELSNLQLNGTTTINDTLIINATNITLPSVLGATTTKAGLGEIASITELGDATQVVTDASLEGSGPRFITPEGLEYWRVQRKLISQKTGTTSFYIVPDNAVMGGTYVFNGTSYTLTMDPSRSQAELTSNQAPNTPTRAVKFSVAVQFANADLATTETANYYLANGCYWTAVEFRHIANVRGATSAFLNTNEVSSTFESGSTPTTNVKALYDNYSLPTFGATFEGGTSTFYDASQVIAYSAHLKFTVGGSIDGISFVGMDKMIADSTNWPNSLFAGGSTFRSSGANPVASFANSWYAVNGGSATFYHYYQSPRIYTEEGSLHVQNVISGPGLPGRGGKGSGFDSSLVDMRNSSLSMNGIYLLGNVRVTPADLPAITNKLTANVTGCQHLQALVSGYNSDNTLIGVSFPLYVGTNPTPTTNAYNYDVNCVHILTSSGTYGTVASKGSATVSQRGAAFRTIIGVLGPGTKLSTGGYDSYRIQGVPTNKHHGFAGTFGNAIDYQALSSGTDYSPFGITYFNTIDTERLNSYVTHLFQQAVTGAAITSTLPTTAANAAVGDTTTDNQTGGIYYAYTTSGISSNVLNINTFTWRRGVNTNSGGRNSTLFYG